MIEVQSKKIATTGLSSRQSSKVRESGSGQGLFAAVFKIIVLVAWNQL